jgi:hypothetical protein
MHYALRIMNLGGRPRKRGTPTRSRDQRNATGWSSGFSRSQRESGKSDRVTIAVLIFEEQLMHGKDFTTETRRHGGFSQWVRGAATWPETAVSTASGDLGPLTLSSGLRLRL